MLLVLGFCLRGTLVAGKRGTGLEGRRVGGGGRVAERLELVGVERLGNDCAQRFVFASLSGAVLAQPVQGPPQENRKVLFVRRLLRGGDCGTRTVREIADARAVKRPERVGAAEGPCRAILVGGFAHAEALLGLLARGEHCVEALRVLAPLAHVLIEHAPLWKHLNLLRLHFGGRGRSRRERPLLLQRCKTAQLVGGRRQKSCCCLALEGVRPTLRWRAGEGGLGFRVERLLVAPL